MISQLSERCPEKRISLARPKSTSLASCCDGAAGSAMVITFSGEIAMNDAMPMQHRQHIRDLLYQAQLSDQIARLT